MEILIQVLRSFAAFLMEAAPFMLLGLFFAGLLKAFLPDDIIKNHFGPGKRGGIFKASAFGVPIPLCSCGVVPAAAGIRKQGGGKGPVVSFLISTPETGVDSVAITWALLGPVMAVIRPVAAFITALFTGFLVHIFDNDSKDTLSDASLVEANCGCSSGSCATGTPKPLASQKVEAPGCGCSYPDSPASPSRFSRFKNGMHFAFIELTGDIAGWFIIGVLFAAVIAVFVTPEMINTISGGNSLVIMAVMLLISVPLYVCATSSTPIAAAFLLTGISPGAAIVFLLAGPATNAASFSVISKLIGKKSALIYLIGIIVSSLAIGIATDFFFTLTGYQVIPAAGHVDDGPGFYLQLISAIVLSVFLVYPFIKNRMTSTTFASNT